MSATKTQFKLWVAEQLREDRERHKRAWYVENLADGGCDCGLLVNPTRWVEQGDWITASYRCETCGREWTCGWARELVENGQSPR